MTPLKSQNDGRRHAWLMGFIVSTELMLVLATTRVAFGQSAWPTGHHWSARRVITLQTPPADDKEIFTIEFLSHGELTDEHPGLMVLKPHHVPVPCKLLSRGPGDLMRIAFQGAKNTAHYEVYYGGDSLADPAPWTADNGLLLDVRRFVDCDLNDPKSVLAAWNRASPLGSDYVPNVFQGFLPFADQGTPALARFTGRLQISKPGEYRFYTSSYDASWLQIDGETVVAWPGRHGHEGEGRHFGDRQLTAGNHAFEYLYASSGAGYVAVAAWKPPGEERIVPIPPEVFGDFHRATATRPQLRNGGMLPDLQFEIVAETPIGPERPPLIRVKFTTANSDNVHKWDFGDGQAATGKEGQHIFLLPGEYLVRCKPSKGRAFESRIQIHPPRPPIAPKDPPEDIADWAAELREYDVRKMTAPTLLQLVNLFAELEDFERAGRMGIEGLRQRSRGAPPLEPQATALFCLELAHLLDSPLNRLKDALAVCKEGLDLNPTGEPQLKLLLVAIDLALKLDQPEEGDRFLVAAKSQLTESTPPALRSRLLQLQGDLFRRKGDRDHALTSYHEASQHAVSNDWDARQRVVFPGAYSRSIEEYLRANDLALATKTLNRWSAELPLSHLDGYYTLLKGNCYLAYDQPREAALEATDLLQIAEDDPYADRLLLLIAEAQFRLHDTAAANSILERLLREYPGSPHVSTAKIWLKEGPAKPEKTPKAKPSSSSKKEGKGP